MELLNTLYILSVILEFAAFIKLRFAHPELHRPWRVPIGNRGMVAVLSLPSIFLCYMLYLSPAKTWAIIGASLVVGCALYWVLGQPRTRACCRFRFVPGEGEEVQPGSSSEDEDEEEEEEEGGSSDREMGMGIGEDVEEGKDEFAAAGRGGALRPGLLRYGSDGEDNFVAV